MPPKKQEGVARFRVTLPQDAYDRMAIIANQMSIDVPTLVRVMASLQLVQWEHMANPMRMLTPEVQAQIAREWTQQAAPLFPEVDRTELVRQGEPEAESEAEPRQFGLRPRGDLDEALAVSSLDDRRSFDLLESMLSYAR